LIDAHVHVWRIGANGCTWPTSDLAPIHRDFGLDDLRNEARGAGLDGVVLVQSQEGGADTEWLLDLAKDPLVLGVVGWTDFEAAAAADRIARLAASPALCGVRPMVQDRPAVYYDDALLEPAWAALAVHGLVLDALVRPAHLGALLRLAGRHADLAIVIDHAAKPDFARLGDWREAIAPFAKRLNVACKFSGLFTELAPGQDREPVEAAFAILWEIFGADRLIWGSDWPVIRLAGDYGGWLGFARRLVPRQHHQAVFGGNARRIYNLPGADAGDRGE
jgi:L-fuconolactonase